VAVLRAHARVPLERRADYRRGEGCHLEDTTGIGISARSPARRTIDLDWMAGDPLALSSGVIRVRFPPEVHAFAPLLEDAGLLP
jgi:hypothetical protein